jgi:hypothetical protein
MVIAAITAYLGTAIFGIPAYLLLRARGITSIWVAVIFGLLIGVVTWFLLAIAFPLSLGQGVPGVKAGFMLPSVYWGALVPAGVLGMIVGALFWFIARPDRDHL